MPKTAPVTTAPAPTARVAKSEAPKAKTAEPGRGRPQRFTYALKCYTAERRADGWWIGKTPLTSAGEKPDWSGSFQNIEKLASPSPGGWRPKSPTATHA